MGSIASQMNFLPLLLSHSSTVIVKFLQVNPKIKSSDIEEYFEKKAQCFVSSIVNLSDGNCELHLSGISDKRKICA